MTLRRLVLVVIAAAMLAVPAYAGAAKLPKYQVYQKCDKSGICTVGAYFNEKHKRAITLQTSKKCSDGSYVSISFSGSAKVSSKGKFSVSVGTYNSDVTTGKSIGGNGKIEGKVKKKEKVTLNWSVDNVPAACPKSGTLTAKYKGTQSGG